MKNLEIDKLKGQLNEQSNNVNFLIKIIQNPAYLEIAKEEIEKYKHKLDSNEIIYKITEKIIKK